MIELKFRKQLWSPSGGMDLDIDLDIQSGRFVTLYGKSGAGKTSILRIIAGLLSPDKGLIKVRDKYWFDSAEKINKPPQERLVGLVFQDYALFPHLTVKENMIFALKKGQDAGIVSDLIEIMELGELQQLKPETLSGGQKQRVALARALVQKPGLLMLDEPLSALDREMRIKLQHYLLKVHKEFGLTTMLVSHDVSEILKMSDQVVELDQGQIVRQSTPGEFFTHAEVSGKFQFTGEVISKEKQDFIFIVTILIGKELVKVVAEESEAGELSPGDQVLVASKAFNPIIKKID